MWGMFRTPFTTRISKAYGLMLRVGKFNDWLFLIKRNFLQGEIYKKF